MKSAFFFITALFVIALNPAYPAEPSVKQSSRGICHDQRSPHYARTRNYQPFNTLDECLASDGRLPASQQNLSASDQTDYDRNAFRHWTRPGDSCLNTRHALLKSQSTSTISKNDTGCLVTRGRWNDPYTGEVFFDSSQVDVDHLVPLRWAWDNGASSWNDAEREQFANDERNLFIVSASANRSKGAKGPGEWLPPNQAFHCQYVTRFVRVLLLYEFPDDIRDRKRQLQQEVCT